MTAMRNPPHPGETVRRDCVEASGLSVTEAARLLAARPVAPAERMLPASRPTWRWHSSARAGATPTSGCACRRPATSPKHASGWPRRSRCRPDQNGLPRAPAAANRAHRGGLGPCGSRSLASGALRLPASTGPCPSRTAPPSPGGNAPPASPQPLTASRFSAGACANALRLPSVAFTTAAGAAEGLSRSAATRLATVPRGARRHPQFLDAPPLPRAFRHDPVCRPARRHQGHAAPQELPRQRLLARFREHHADDVLRLEFEAAAALRPTSGCRLPRL